MKNRRRFRPGAVEVMEKRIVLSHAAPGLKVGVLGDSFSDEYSFYPPDRSQARNWVEILAASEGVNFGAYRAAKATATRNHGFANDYARSGATTTQMVAEELPGLAQSVRAGKVNAVAILAGSNDFANLLQNDLLAPRPAAATAISVEQIEGGAENNTTTAVETITLANINSHVVLYTLPDVTQLPAIKAEYAGKESRPILAQVSEAIQEYNTHIENLASGNGRIVVVDLASQLTSLESQGASGSLQLFGTTVNTATPSDDYHSLFLADGLHLGTLGQAVIANDFLSALNTQVNTGLSAISSAQVMRLVRQLPSR